MGFIGFHPQIGGNKKVDDSGKERERSAPINEDEDEVEGEEQQDGVQQGFKEEQLIQDVP